MRVDHHRTTCGGFRAWQRPARGLLPRKFGDDQHGKHHTLTLTSDNPCKQPSRKNAVEETRQAYVPAQICIQEPESEVNRDNAGQRDEHPLPPAKCVANNPGHKCKSREIQEQMGPAKMYQMTRDESPELPHLHRVPIVSEGGSDFIAPHFQQQRYCDDDTDRHPALTQICCSLNFV